MIGDEIEVSVLAVTGEKVRLGITAPRAVPVFRKEVYVEIHDEAPAGAEEATEGSSDPSEGEAGESDAAAAQEAVNEAIDRLKSDR